MYFLKTAFQNIWREKWINILTILSISIGLLILSSFVMVTLNLNSVLEHWSKGFGLVVYLDERISPENEGKLKYIFGEDKDFTAVTYVSKEQAIQNVRKALGEDAIIIDEIKENPLPSSFELKLEGARLEPVYVQQKVSVIEQMSGVAEVQYGEKWLSSLNAISRTMQICAVVLGCAIFIAVTFMAYSTIKIFFYRRKDEVETLKLLGATKSFIKFPFMIEGLFIGTIGGIVCSLTIFGAYSFTTLRIAEFLPSIRMIMAVLPLKAYFVIPVAGAMMSLTGSFIAVGKIRY